MSGITIGWNNATPTSNGLVGQGDDEIRSLKSNVQGALDAEHLYPSGGGLAGVHRAGSARVFVGPTSQVSSADTTGRLMWDSSRSQLVYVGAEVGGSPVAIGGGSGLNVLFPALSAGSRWQVSLQSYEYTTGLSGPISSQISAGQHFHFLSCETTGVNPLDASPVPILYSVDTLFNQFNLTVYDGSSGTASFYPYPCIVNILTVGFGPG